jgi:CRP-like cAMP-binding protein
METLASIVATHSFTKDISPRFLARLIQCATLAQFGSSQEIFREGSDADHFYLIHRGQVALQTFVPGAGAMTLQTIGANEALGWSWLYPPYRWHFGAVALEPVEAAALDTRSLRSRMESDHEFGYVMASRIGHVMLDRLQATRLRLLEMYGAPG